MPDPSPPVLQHLDPREALVLGELQKRVPVSVELTPATGTR